MAASGEENLLERDRETETQRWKRKYMKTEEAIEYWMQMHRFLRRVASE